MSTIDWGVNLDEISDSFEPVPDGIYHVAVDSYEQGTTRTNKRAINFRFSIQDDTVSNGDGKDIRVRDRVLFHRFIVDKNSAWFYKQLHKAATGDDPVGRETSLDDVVGQEVLVNVTREQIKRTDDSGELKDTGEFRNIIKRFMPLPR